MIWTAILGKVVTFLLGVFLIQWAFRAPMGLGSASDTTEQLTFTIEDVQPAASPVSSDSPDGRPSDDDVMPHENDDAEAINTPSGTFVSPPLPEEVVENPPVSDPVDEEPAPPPTYIVPPPPAPPVAFPNPELSPCQPTWYIAAHDCQPVPPPCSSWDGSPSFLSERACLVE